MSINNESRPLVFDRIDNDGTMNLGPQGYGWVTFYAGHAIVVTLTAGGDYIATNRTLVIVNATKVRYDLVIDEAEQVSAEATTRYEAAESCVKQLDAVIAQRLSNGKAGTPKVQRWDEYSREYFASK